MINKLIFNQRY